MKRKERYYNTFNPDFPSEFLFKKVTFHRNVAIFWYKEKKNNTWKYSIMKFFENLLVSFFFLLSLLLPSIRTLESYESWMCGVVAGICLIYVFKKEK